MFSKVSRKATLQLFLKKISTSNLKISDLPILQRVFCQGEDIEIGILAHFFPYATFLKCTKIQISQTFPLLGRKFAAELEDEIFQGQKLKIF